MNYKPLNPAEADISEAIQALARHVDGRFDRVDEQFAQANLRFGRIDERLDRMNERLERIEFQVTGQAQRIEILEDKVLQLARHAGLSFN